MGRAKIAVQASTIKNKFKELGPYETLKKMAEVGYHCIELSQIDMSPASIEEIKRAQKDFDIEVCSISGSTASRGANEPNLVDNLDVFIDQCNQLGCKYIRIGMMPFTEFATMEKLKAYAALCEEICLKLAPHGIKLYYHNHHAEYQKKDGKTVFEIVSENAPHLGNEIDVHWVQRGGCDPIDIISKCKGNLDLLHLKDYRIKEITPEAFQGEGMQAMMGFFKDYFPNCVQFAEIGEGNLNWPAIIEAGLAAGSKYLIVEQDDTYGRDEFESLRISAEYLKKIGYADCF